MRAAVDLENQRILLRRVEVRRLQDPALDVLAVEALVPDLFGLALLDVFEEIVVDVSDLARASRASARYPPHRQIAMSPMLVCVDSVAAIFRLRRPSR